MRREGVRFASKATLALWVLGAGGSWAMAGCSKPAEHAAVSAEGAATARGPVAVGTAVATAESLADTLSATGSLVADQQSQITPIVPGRVMAVLVERGQRVREGDALLRVRDADYRTQAATASAGLSQARARLGLDEPGANGSFRAENTAEVRAAAAQRDLADDALRRAEQLHQSGAMSDADYQRTVAQSTAAREQYRSAVNNMRGAYFQYQQAREQLSAAQRNVSDSVVRAPFAGEVAERPVNVGEYVSPQRAVVTLVNTTRLRMEMQIPQERIARVRQGQAVSIRVDAFPDRVFAATVEYISAAVRADTRSLVAEAVIPNDDGALRPGMFATARVDLGSRRNVVAVPLRAVVREGGTDRVFVNANGRASERVIQVLDRNERAVLVERGVTAGEQVVIEGVAECYDGATLTARAAGQAAPAQAPAGR